MVKNVNEVVYWQVSFSVGLNGRGKMKKTLDIEFA